MLITSTIQTRCCFILTVFLIPEDKFLFAECLKSKISMAEPELWGNGRFERRGATLKFLLIRKCPEIKWPSLRFLIFFVEFVTLWGEQGTLGHWLILCQNSASDCRSWEIFWGRRISKETCGLGTQFVWGSTFWWAMEREQESSLLYALAAKNFNRDRHDSDQTPDKTLQRPRDHDRGIGCSGVLWNPVWRIFELSDKPLSGVTVSVADAASGQREGPADLSRSFPAHVVVIERKVQLLMMRVTGWVDSRGNAWWMVPYLAPLLLSLPAGISVQSDYTFDCSALFSQYFIVLFVLHNLREKVAFFIFSVTLGVKFYFLC